MLYHVQVLYLQDCLNNHDKMQDDSTPEWSVLISSQDSELACLGTLISHR